MFPSEEPDPESSLGDIFECALQQSESAVQRELNRCLRVDPSALPQGYRDWFSLPWFRVYTLNIDDLEEAVQRQYSQATRYESLSINDPLPNPSSAVTYVHLNGRLSEFPRVTFSPMQYADRLPGKDPWYAALAADLVGRSFLFVGSSLDEPPIWDHMALRGERARHARELRPRSFLVTPSLPTARRRLLAEFNIDWIPMDQEMFLTDVLMNLVEEAHSGREMLRIRQGQLSRSPVRSIGEIRSEFSDVNLSQYLLGREPAWQDITEAEEGFAELEDAIKRRGAEDSYPYHVLGSQGLRYVRRAPLLPMEKERILGRILDCLKQGTSLYRNLDELRTLRADAGW